MHNSRVIQKRNSRVIHPYKLNLYTLAEAIIVATPVMYKNDALTMRTALAMLGDNSEILKILVDTGQTVRAGRVIGAFRNIGRSDIADEIAGTMKRIGYDVSEEDPFETQRMHLPHVVIGKLFRR